VKSRIVASVVLFLAAVAASAVAQDLTIDDFTTGHYQSPGYKSGLVNRNIQAGSMMGGSRDTVMDVGVDTHDFRPWDFDEISLLLTEKEFQLLLSLIRPHPETGDKSIVIFYDDAENLYARPRPTWSQIGINVVGGGRSRVMKECFRNSREIVEFAFNVLLGSRAPAEEKVQAREYADVTYLKENGLVEELV
jgi:hypothetical protein